MLRAEKDLEVLLAVKSLLRARRCAIPSDLWSAARRDSGHLSEGCQRSSGICGRNSARLTVVQDVTAVSSSLIYEDRDEACFPHLNVVPAGQDVMSVCS